MNLAARTAAVALVWTALASIGCISRHPATDTGDTATAATAASPISPTAPTSPTTPTPAPSPTPTPAPVTVLVAYDKDIAPVLNTDCLR